MHSLFAISRILIFLLVHVVNSSAQTSNSTSSCSSSCGNIRKISFPFRLKGDPITCGDRAYELDCQNNQTILTTVSSKTYIVQEINYSDFWIRLADIGLKKDDSSSCPAHSFSYDDWSYVSYSPNYSDPSVVFVNCLKPVNSSRYVEAPPRCVNRSRVFTNDPNIYSYVMVGDVNVMFISDLEDSCMVYGVQQVWGERLIKNNASWAGIHDSLAYGFVLSWSRAFCKECESKDGTCILDGSKVTCKYYCMESTPISELSLRCKFEYWGFFVGMYSVLAISGLLALRFVFGIIFLIGLVIYKWRRRHLALDASVEDFLRTQNNLTPIKYTYSEIKKMTSNFRQMLGEGAYGKVYKGKLRSGPYVAVKMTGQSMASEQEFMSEVGTIGRIHHVNVVQLIGFCAEGSKRCLVYEFLPNGSLDKYIFTQPFKDFLYLRYDKMFEIALGVARGIDYLHSGCDMQILHFDIKPHNILLDEKFAPKISDFGLAKLYPANNSVVNLTDARGTMGYMAPEMFYNNIGRVSYKADVYSFGMLLLEMAGRRQNVNPFAEDVSQIYFPSWVYDQIHAGKEIDMRDASEEQKKMVKKIIVVALWCIQMKPSDRPSMNKVVEMLEGDSQPPMPPKPFLAPPEITDGYRSL